MISLSEALQRTLASVHPKALLIDMDGTIVDSLPMLFEAYCSFLNQFGQTGTSQEFQSLIGPSLPEVVALLKKRYLIESEVDLTEIYQQGLIEAYRHKVRPFPFVREVLTYAKARDFKLALISSAEKHLVEACLEGLAFSFFFDAIITKQKDLRSKPAPDLYLAALDVLQIDSAAALAIEDAPSGVAAATAAGVFTLWICHGAPLPNCNMPKESYLYVKDWKEILSVLKGIKDA